MDMLLLFISILLLSGSIVWWLDDIKIAGRTFKFLIGASAALVIHSLIFDLSVICSLPYMLCIISGILVNILLLALLYRHEVMPALRLPHITISSIGALGLLYFISIQFIPHSGRWGRWDARAIWTMHAAFLYHQDHWRNLFDPAIAWTHADYPLMLPCLISMCWRALGEKNALVPCIIAYSTLLFACATIYSALSRVNRFGALVALCALALTPVYAKVAAYQGADSLVGLFILTTVILASLSDRGRIGKLLFLTGWFCGFAGWVKNEGLVFTLIFSAIFLWRYRKNPVLALYYAAGLITPLITILIFKLWYAPHNDIMAGQSIETISRWHDMARHRITLRFFFDNVLENYWVLLVLIGLILIKGYKRLLSYQLLILLGVLAVYYITFILTPRDLTWHLETAAFRLFVQLLPAFVFVLIYSGFARKEAL